jgi:hypothetical protein
VGDGSFVALAAGVADGEAAVAAIADVEGCGAIEEPDEGFVEPQAASAADAMSRPSRCRV